MHRAQTRAQHIYLRRPHATNTRHCRTQAQSRRAHTRRIHFGRVNHAGQLGRANCELGGEIEGHRDVGRLVSEVDGYQIGVDARECHARDECVFATETVENDVAGENREEFENGGGDKYSMWVHVGVEVSRYAHTNS